MGAQLDRFAAAAVAAQGLPGALFNRRATNPQTRPWIFNRFFNRIGSYPQVI
jgi:hypothetical protein